MIVVCESVVFDLALVLVLVVVVFVCVVDDVRSVFVSVCVLQLYEQMVFL